MQAKPNMHQIQPPKCSVLVIAGQSDLRSGLTALLRSLPQVGHIYFADTNQEVEEIVSAQSVRLAILDREYVGNRMSELLIKLRSKAINVITLGELDNDGGRDTESGSYVMKGVRPEKLVMEIQKKC